MKHRIVRKQSVLENGDICTWFIAQYRSFFIWWNVKEYHGCYGGGSFETIVFKTDIEAFKWLDEEIVRRRKVKQAEVCCVPWLVVDEREE